MWLCNVSADLPPRNTRKPLLLCSKENINKSRQQKNKNGTLRFLEFSRMRHHFLEFPPTTNGLKEIGSRGSTWIKVWNVVCRTHTPTHMHTHNTNTPTCLAFNLWLDVISTELFPNFCNTIVAAVKKKHLAKIIN